MVLYIPCPGFSARIKEITDSKCRKNCLLRFFFRSREKVHCNCQLCTLRGEVCASLHGSEKCPWGRLDPRYCDRSTTGLEHLHQHHSIPMGKESKNKHVTVYQLLRAALGYAVHVTLAY